MKKILIFSLVYYPSHVGGAEVAIKEITDRIDSQDIEFDMVCLRFDKNLPKVEKVGNVAVYRIGFTADKPTMADLKKFPLHLNKLLFQFTAAIKAHRLYKKNKYDAIWAMMAHSCGVPAGVFKTLHPKVPYILTLQEGDPIDYIKKKMRLLWPLFVRGFIKADIIQSISTFLAKWAREMRYKGPIEIIPNAVDISHFSQEYAKEELDALKNNLGKKGSDFYLITTSRLVPKNGVGDVVESLQYLPENIKFLIIGVGPLEEELKLKIKNLKLDNRVAFLGHIDHKEMPKYLKISDIFIRPSLSEGLGNSFLEAMAAGIPVIATPVGGIPDFLKDGETGLFCEVGSPESIAEKVNVYLENKALREKIIMNAKKLVEEKYNWDNIAKKMEEVLKTLFQHV